MLMLRWTSLICLGVFVSGCFADNVTFLRIDSSVVQQRMTAAPQTSEQRVQTLRTLFEKAGCSKANIEVQTVPGQAFPNVLCTLPGTEYGAILIATRIDYDGRGDEGAVGWGGAVMLPLLVESLNATTHRHTLIFAAFSGDANAGAAWYWKNLSDTQRREFRGMVDLDHVGRTAAAYSAANSGIVMARLLPPAARALRISPEPKAIADVPEGGAEFFARAHVPAITIYSAAYLSNDGDASSSDAKISALLPADMHQPPPSTPRSYALKTGLDPAAYNETYNLLCVYVLFLDRGLGASKRHSTEVQLAKASPTPPTALASTAPAGTPPLPSESAPAPPAIEATAAVPVVVSTPPPTANAVSQASATIHVNARLVQFDVVVTDSQGHPVKDLTQADFTVLQDGKAQTIRAFELHTPAVPEKTSPTAPAVTLTAAKPVANTFSNVPAKALQTSWTIILFDLLNTAVSDQAYARNQLVKLLSALPRGEPAALFVLTRQLEMLQGFTDDPDQLVLMAKRLDPATSQLLTTIAERERTASTVANTAQQAMGAPVAPGGQAIDTSTMVYAQTARIMQAYNDHEAFRTTDRVIFTLEAMRGLARAVSGYPGRKNMVWLSGSFPVQIEPDPASTDPFRNERGFEGQIRQTSSLLATSRVAVYPVDVRGLQSQGFDITSAASQTQVMTNAAPEGVHGVVGTSPSSLGANITAESAALSNDRATMKNIAEQTGGEAFVNTNDLGRVIRRSLEDGSTYYTLAYTPPKEDADGGYHRVVVHIQNKGLKLAYRRGYYSIPQTTVGAAAGTAALRAALQPGMPPATSLLLTTSLELPDASRRDVKVNYVIDSNGVDFADVADNKKHVQVDCMVIAFDSTGKEVAHASDTLDATIPMNAYAAVQQYGLPAHQLISLPPGKYNLRIGVMDRTTQQIGTVDAPLEIPATAVAQR